MFHLSPPPGYTYYYPSVSHIGYCYPSCFPQFSTENTVKIPKNNDFMNNRCYQQQCQQFGQQHFGINQSKDLTSTPSTQEHNSEQDPNQQFLQHELHAKHYSVTDNNLCLDVKNRDLAEVNNTAILPDLEYILLPKEQLPAQEEASIEDMERLPKRHLLWTDKEDNLLMNLRVHQKLRWREISFHFPNRSINSCQFRWKKLKLIKQMSKITGNKNINKISKNPVKYSKLKSLYPETLTEKKINANAKNPNNNMIPAGHTSNIKLLLN